MLINQSLFPADLRKLSDVVKNDVVKKDAYNAKIKNIEDEIPEFINLVTNASLKTKKIRSKVKYLVLLPQLQLLLLLLLEIKQLMSKK